MSNVLVTSVDSVLGGRIAEALATQHEMQVVGLGVPGTSIPGVAVRPMPANAEALVDLLREAHITTVVQPTVAGEEQLLHSREHAVRDAVLGTTALIGACARAGVQRLVLRSSTLIYGGDFANPAFFSEDRPVRRPSFPCLQRDYCEIEAFVADFAARRQDLNIVLLRCAPLVGGGMSSPFVRYLAQSQPQTIFGFDPRIQLLHPADAVAAFVCAARADAAGSFNIASSDLVTLTQAIRLAGKQPMALPGWLLDGMARVDPAGALATLPCDPALLRYACVADTSRAQQVLGWQPAHSAVDTLTELRSAEASEVVVTTLEESPALVSDQTVPGTTPEELLEIEVVVRNAPEDVNGQRDLAVGLLALARSNLDTLQRIAPEQVRPALAQWRERTSDYLDHDFWLGIGVLLRYQFDELRGFVERRLSGNYRIDSYGLDWEIVEAVRPFLRFLYTTWWRTTVTGLEHVPAQGRALLVANHSGVLPWDGAMVSMAVLEEHPQPRMVRNLFLGWFSTLPGVAPLLTSLGQVHGLPENAVRLLAEDELVCVFPEGLKGVGKPFKDRYKLARFGRGGFVQAALRTGAPLIPVAIVGAEETYPLIANIQPLARLLGFPYVPITPFFPWFGLFGAIPIPTKWHITFCQPVPIAEYGPEGADDPLLVAALSDRIRATVQSTLDQQIAARQSIFL